MQYVVDSIVFVNGCLFGFFTAVIPVVLILRHALGGYDKGYTEGLEYATKLFHESADKMWHDYEVSLTETRQRFAEEVNIIFKRVKEGLRNGDRS